MNSQTPTGRAAATAAHLQGPGRLALLCTPRSGNHWLRHLVGGLYDIPTRGVHTPDEVDWARIPEDWLFAIHWRPSAPFLERLERYGFRVIVLVRHPLDVLISVLQFCWRSDSTARWLDGEDGDERPLWGAMPRSTAFVQYASGLRAAALLSIGVEWHRLPGTMIVRYEDLVADGPGTLSRLVGSLGGQPRKTPAEVLQSATLQAMRVTTGCDYHFWQGKTGLWKILLTAAEVKVLNNALAPVLAELNYDSCPDPHLTAAQADANWINLVGQDLVEDLRSLEPLRRDVREMKAALEWRRAVQDYQAASLERNVREMKAELEWRRAVQDYQAASLERNREVCTRLQTELASLKAENQRLASLNALGPVSLGIAARLHQLAKRAPRAAALGRALARLVAGGLRR